MLTIITMLLKFQFSMTSMLALSFTMAMREIQAEAGDLRLEVEGLEAQGELRVIPADEPAPAEPAEEAKPAE